MEGRSINITIVNTLAEMLNLSKVTNNQMVLVTKDISLGIPTLYTLQYLTNKKSINGWTKLSGSSGTGGGISKAEADTYYLAIALASQLTNAYNHSLSTHAPSDAVNLSTVKADSAIADSLTKRHSHTNSSILASIQESLTTILKGNYDYAYTHSISTHAPSDAQKNSDITKEEIEAKLIGEINTHTHPGGSLSFANILTLTTL